MKKFLSVLLLIIGLVASCVGGAFGFILPWLGVQIGSSAGFYMLLLLAGIILTILAIVLLIISKTDFQEDDTVTEIEEVGLRSTGLENDNETSVKEIYFDATELEYIQPKMSVKGKKVIMGILIALYSLLLLAGILLATVPALQSVISSIGICEEISARAYGITIGVMWISLTPSVGYYFATISPFELSKKKKIVIAVISTLLLLVLNVVFFIVISTIKIDGIAVKKYYETSDSWFMPLSMVFASLGIIICYALTLFRINPEKIKDIKHEQSGSGIFELLKHLFISLIGLVVKLIKGILKFKEKQVDIFILIATILLTWLVFFAAFIFAIICIALFVVVIIMLFAGVCSMGYSGSESPATYEVNDGGYLRTLKYHDYDSFEGLDRFKDDIDTYWYKLKNGKFIKEKDFKEYNS